MQIHTHANAYTQQMGFMHEYQNEGTRKLKRTQREHGTTGEYGSVSNTVPYAYLMVSLLPSLS